MSLFPRNLEGIYVIYFIIIIEFIQPYFISPYFVCEQVCKLYFLINAMMLAVRLL